MFPCGNILKYCFNFFKNYNTIQALHFCLKQSQKVVFFLVPNLLPASISDAYSAKFPAVSIFQLTLTLNTLKGGSCFLWSCFDKVANGSPRCRLERNLSALFFFWPLCFILREFTSWSFLKLSTPGLLWQNSFLIFYLSDYKLKSSFIRYFLFLSYLVTMFSAFHS